jgi:hypothetical protein
LIHEPHIKPYYRCNSWHVRGRDRDLLLDSGIGVVGLRRQVALLAEQGGGDRDPVFRRHGL